MVTSLRHRLEKLYWEKKPRKKMKTFITLEGHLIDLNGVQVLTPHFDPETGKGSHYVVKTRDGEFRLGWKNGYALEKKLRNRR